MEVAMAVTWTREPPTKAGWYWYTEGVLNVFDYPVIVEVVAAIDRSLIAWYAGCEREETVAGMSGHWLGPLPVPEMPKVEG
jgi:hypothetical protein